MRSILTYVLVHYALSAMSSTVVLAQSKPEVFVNTKYNNRDLGFDLEVPNGWTLSTESTSLESGNTSKAKDTSTNNQQDIPAAKQWKVGKQVELFTITKKGTRDITSPGLRAGADELLGGSSVTPLEYMRFIAAKEDRIKSMLPFVIDGDAFEVTIGGVKYSALSVHIEFDEVGVLKDRLLAVTKNGYAVYFILSYRTDEELRELEQLVASIKYRLDRPTPSTGH
jgi:hypothetical protein